MIYRNKTELGPFVRVSVRFSEIYVSLEWLNNDFGLPMKIDSYIVLNAQLDLTQ